MASSCCRASHWRGYLACLFVAISRDAASFVSGDAKKHEFMAHSLLKILGVLMFCGTISLVTCGLLIGKDQLRLVLVSAAMFAKTFAGISWDVANIYANEIYPTKVRTFGSSCCQSACHVSRSSS